MEVKSTQKNRLDNDFFRHNNELSLLDKKGSFVVSKIWRVRMWDLILESTADICCFVQLSSPVKWFFVFRNPSQNTQQKEWKGETSVAVVGSYMVLNLRRK